MPDFKTKITVNNQDVEIDSALLKFNEANLSKYLEHEAGWYDYFGNKLADAELEYQKAELRVETLYSDKFTTFKENGASDKLAEASAKRDIEVEAAKEVALELRRHVKLLTQHLKAWDKNHENAQSRGHFLRKEIDKLNSDVYFTNRNQSNPSLEERIDDIIGASSSDL